mmetsp:Transcript_67941/g.167783  ORF Transcript_67941/g.167783 Transcript_67941/m.167783 type:complete len:227 (-) Transcript_67941:415-1095(-)
MSHNVIEHSLNIIALRAAAREVPALQRLWLDTLKVEVARVLLTSLTCAGPPPNRRQAPPPVSTKQLINQPQAVPLVRPKWQKRSHTVRIRRLNSVGVHPHPRGEGAPLPFEGLYVTHGHGARCPVDNDGEAHSVLGGEAPRVWVGAESWGLSAERHDLGEGRCAVGVTHVPLLSSVQHVAPPPEVVERVVDSDDAHAVRVREAHALVHGVVGHRLPHLLLGVPALD